MAADDLTEQWVVFTEMNPKETEVGCPGRDTPATDASTKQSRADRPNAFRETRCRQGRDPKSARESALEFPEIIVSAWAGVRLHQKGAPR